MRADEAVAEQVQPEVGVAGVGRRLGEGDRHRHHVGVHPSFGVLAGQRRQRLRSVPPGASPSSGAGNQVSSTVPSSATVASPKPHACWSSGRLESRGCGDMAKRLPVRNRRRHEGKTGVTKFKEPCMDTARSDSERGQF